jgi:hypothetical protein
MVKKGGRNRRSTKQDDEDVDMAEDFMDSQIEEGFFRLSFGTDDSEPHDIPRDIFHHIIQFISPYPYYFTLRSVSKQWLFEFESVIYVSGFCYMVTEIYRTLSQTWTV